MRRALIWPGAMALSACSLIADFGGLSSGDGRPPPSSGDPDATARGDAGEASTSVRDSGDGSATPSFCQRTVHDFCSDFDDPEVGTTAFTGIDLTPNADGAVQVATPRFEPSRRALLVSLPRREDRDTPQRALAYKHLSRPWTRVVLEFDLYAEPIAWLPGDINASVATIEFRSDTTTTILYLVLAKDYTELASTVVASGGTGPAISTERWVHARIEFDPAGTLKAKIENTDYGPYTFAALAPGGSPALAFHIGIDSFNDPIPALTLLYDDVTLDLD